MTKVRIDRYRSEAEVYCAEPGCPMAKRAVRTRTRARLHAQRTGHIVRAVVTDLTVYTAAEAS